MPVYRKIVFCLLFCSFAAHSQMSPGSHVQFLKDGIDNLKNDLQAGYTAFTFKAHDFDMEKAWILKEYLKTQRGKTLVFFVDTNTHVFEKVLPEYAETTADNDHAQGGKNRIYIISNDPQDGSSYIYNEQINTVIATANNSLLFSEYDRPMNLLKAGIIRNDTLAGRTLFNMVYLKGKFPDFIETDSIALFKTITDTLQKRNLHKAIVELSSGEILKDVNWTELPGVATTGIVVTPQLKLSPQKRGYWFSPDIFNFDAYQSNEPKVFKAFKYDLSEKLRFYLPLKYGLNNMTVFDDREVFTDVRIIRDPQRGPVASFNGETSYIDLSGSSDTDFKELTVSAWVKPTAVNGSYSIIGKGETFSAKIYRGGLQFTTPGIKDHESKEFIIKPGQWSHVAFVYLPNRKVFFYLNGELVGETYASVVEQTDHSVLIGSNLWGQFYSGLMSEFCLWNRALSDDEVSEVFRDGVNLKKESYSWLLMICILLGGGVMIYFFRRRRKPVRSMLKRQISENELHGALQKNIPGSVNLLGGFRLVNLEGKDITHLLSPKRKELLTLLILYTLKEDGISSKKMGDLLWPGFSAESVKNNRSTHIKEIRSILGTQLPVHIVFNNKKWAISMDPSVSVDLFRMNQYIPDFLNRVPSVIPTENLISFARISSGGMLVPQLEYEWTDHLKSLYSDAVLNVLSPYLHKTSGFELHETITIIDGILAIDPLYEDAVKTKIEILIKEGKHATAKKVMEAYKKLYISFYNQPTTLNMYDFIK